MKTSTIVLIIVTLIVAVGAYWYFFTGTGNDLPLTTDPTQDEAVSKFQNLVSELQPISFNTSIFSEPKFLALVDLNTSVTPETPGRLDPFAPVPGVSTK